MPAVSIDHWEDVMTTYRMSLSPLAIEDAEVRVQPLLKEAKARMGFIPNLYARMANLPGLYSTYTLAQDAFRREGRFTPAEQEVVLLVISRENGCEYCVGAHSMIAEKVSKAPPQAIDAIRKRAPIADTKLAALADFTQIMLEKRGNPDFHDVERFLESGFTEHHILAIILALAVKTISNYTNHVFHTPLDAAFGSYVWSSEVTAA